MNLNQRLVDDIDALLAFRPALIETSDSEQLNATAESDGHGISVFTTYPRALELFFTRLDASGLHDFDYDPLGIQDRLATADHIEHATLDELRVVLTYMLRSERFCEGSWGAFLSDGTLTRVLDRLAALRTELSA